MTKFSNLVRGVTECWDTRQKYRRCDQVLIEALEEAGYQPIRTLSLGAQAWEAAIPKYTAPGQGRGPPAATQSFNCVPSWWARHTLPPHWGTWAKLPGMCSAPALKHYSHLQYSPGSCSSFCPEMLLLIRLYEKSTSPPKRGSKGAFLVIYPKIFAECLLIWTKPSSGDTKRKKECRV